MESSGRGHSRGRRILSPLDWLPHFRSTFLPRILGVLMAVGGLGWLTFLSPALAKHLCPYNLAVGILGQEFVMLWPLVMGVNVQRWKERQRSG
jgi:uncharacterized membrane protein